MKSTIDLSKGKPGQASQANGVFRGLVPQLQTLTVACHDNDLTSKATPVEPATRGRVLCRVTWAILDLGGNGHEPDGKPSSDGSLIAILIPSTITTLSYLRSAPIVKINRAYTDSDTFTLVRPPYYTVTQPPYKAFHYYCTLFSSYALVYNST